MSETPRHAPGPARPVVSPAAAADRVNLRAVALPVEHGGWGMLGAPLLLGLLVAPSGAGLGVALAALGAFLTHHPAKLLLADWRRGAAYRRTSVALGFVALYGSVAGFGIAVAARGQPGWWVPLAAAAPLAAVQLAYDARLQSRQLLPELMGAVALGSVAAAEMRAAGLLLVACLAAWALLAAKATGAVLYVRARLRHDRGLAAHRTAAVAFHVGALGLALVLARAGYAPWLAVPAFVLLLARAAHGLSRVHPRVRPQVVGIHEMAYGFSFVLLLAVGYTIGR
jgi:YwiC-like protein